MEEVAPAYSVLAEVFRDRVLRWVIQVRHTSGTITHPANIRLSRLGVDIHLEVDVPIKAHFVWLKCVFVGWYMALGARRGFNFFIEKILYIHKYQYISKRLTAVDDSLSTSVLLLHP